MLTGFLFAAGFFVLTGVTHLIGTFLLLLGQVKADEEAERQNRK